ncbi:hypothetical protein [Tenacibaculum amylolyticum]|uniref:hypothetical protein n=1 Tax=Tenacibaculum amylolyticum TaxID=104269 RepID=UPI003892ED89
MIQFIKPFTIITFLLAIIAITSCNNNDDFNSGCKETFCTEEFRTIVVSIKDQDQNPVVLDSFEVINLENGENMTISLTVSGLEMAHRLGQYPLVDDGSLGMSEERQIQFKGYINNEEVISREYTVSTDCCHIDVVSGMLEFIL